MNGTYHWSPKKGKWDPAGFAKFKKPILIGFVALVVLIGLLTSIYTVDDKQQAVVTTFGKVTDITDAGLHFKLPFGIQQVQKVDVSVYQKIELGYATQSDGTTITNTGESTMITGDYNIVNVDFFVEYKITDPVAYLYSSSNPESILRNLVQSQVRNVVGSSNVDAVLTTGRDEIQRQVRELVTKILEEYNIGLTLVQIRLQDAEAPTPAVNAAFQAVKTAEEEAVAMVNDANAYKNTQIPKAEAEADGILENAEFLKQNRINEALQQVAMFEAMYKEYANNPSITRSRMYYETISAVLPGVKVYINTGSGENIDMLLPLESLTGGAAQ